jgi:ornithine carbamoyltransferase
MRLDPVAAIDLELVLANARRLRSATDPRQRKALLRGRNLALLCESADSADAVRFRDAATELGALVSHLRPGLSDLSAPEPRRHTARMLGRLYQGIECQGLPADVVVAVGRDACVPVYDGVATATHPSARLASLLDGRDPPERNRQLILQAVLVSTVA